MAMTDSQQMQGPAAGTPEHAAAATHGRNQAVRDGLQWLTFSHLPAALQPYSRPFYFAALSVIREVSDSPELTKALNAITEAKDWAVRAGIRSATGRAGSVPRPQTVVDTPQLATEGAVPATQVLAAPASGGIVSPEKFGKPGETH